MMWVYSIFVSLINIDCCAGQRRDPLYPLDPNPNAYNLRCLGCVLAHDIQQGPLRFASCPRTFPQQLIHISKSRTFSFSISSSRLRPRTWRRTSLPSIFETRLALLSGLTPVFCLRCFAFGVFLLRRCYLGPCHVSGTIRVLVVVGFCI